jgi:hypothetical protein
MLSVDTAPGVVMQTLKQEVMPALPSGQQGQGSDSVDGAVAWGTMSAQWACIAAGVAVAPTMSTMGAPGSNRAAISP